MISYLVFLLLFFFFFLNFEQQAILLLIRFSFDVLFLQNANCWLFSINREKGAAMVKRLGGNSEFTEVNIDDHQSLEAALMGVFTSLFGNYRWYFQLDQLVYCSWCWFHYTPFHAFTSWCSRRPCSGMKSGSIEH